VQRSQLTGGRGCAARRPSLLALAGRALCIAA
jgi:hypothetical protein